MFHYFYLIFISDGFNVKLLFFNNIKYDDIHNYNDICKFINTNQTKDINKNVYTLFAGFCLNDNTIISKTTIGYI